MRFTSKRADKRGNKDWRRPYLGKRKSASFDWPCKPHGRCARCRSDRTHKNRRQELIDE